MSFKWFWILLIIGAVILCGPTILKYLGKFFMLLYNIISKTGYKGII